jgi:hypothetical protein
MRWVKNGRGGPVSARPVGGQHSLGNRTEVVRQWLRGLDTYEPKLLPTQPPKARGVTRQFGLKVKRFLDRAVVTTSPRFMDTRLQQLIGPRA